MGWLALLRLVIKAIGADAEIATATASIRSTSKLLQKILKNPAKYFSKQGYAQFQASTAELRQLQSSLQNLLNFEKIKKKIKGEIVKSTNISQFRNLNQKFKNAIKIEQGEDSEEETNYDDVIGVYVNLSSTALFGGIWIPVLQMTSGEYGIATLTYKTNLSKNYAYPNVSKNTWIDMVNATGSNGTGANSVFNQQYLGNYYGRANRVQTAWKGFNRKASSKSIKSINIAGYQKLTKGYSKYGKL